MDTEQHRICPTFRSEIITALSHQELLLQQYRSFHFTIQSLLFASFVAAYSGLAALHSNNESAAYCFSKWSIKTASMSSLIFVIFLLVLCSVVLIVGVLVLSHVMVVSDHRSKNVSFCQSLLRLDDMNVLAAHWKQYMRLKNGGTVGMEIAIRLFEHRSFSNELNELLQTVDFEKIRSLCNTVRLDERGTSRFVFEKKIPLYFCGLWYSATLAIFFYFISQMFCVLE